MTYEELLNSIQYPNFHDSGLVSLKIEFLDEKSLEFTQRVVISIATSFKDDPEDINKIDLVFSHVCNLNITASMNDERFYESSGIDRLSYDGKAFVITTQKGWEMSFQSDEVNIINSLAGH